MTFVVKDPALTPGWSRRLEAVDEEDAIRQIAEEYADENGEPDWAFANSFIYEEE